MISLKKSTPSASRPYLNLASEAAYVGEALVVLGQAARGGRGVIGSVTDFGGDPLTGGAGITTRAFTFSYGPVGQADDAHAESGDSGSPSFALRGGRVALVGTHTAILQALGTTTTYDTLVPHYVPELNALMEVSGLRMRKINPAPASFSTTGATGETVVRAGSPFTFQITLTNGPGLAENVRIDATQAQAIPSPAVSADGWFSPIAHNIRRGRLGPGESTEILLDFAAAPASGTAQIAIGLESDGSSAETLQFPITILPSFAEWAAGLEDATPEGDSDGDGISNLLEYAFGGDNRSNSRFFPGSEPPSHLLPTFASEPLAISFIRRTDAAERGLSYVIETSSTLEAASWEILEAPDVSVVSSPGAGFEKVSVSLPRRRREPDSSSLKFLHGGWSHSTRDIPPVFSCHWPGSRRQRHEGGHCMLVIPESEVLITQAAANLLGVSRPHFVSLLESDEIPYHTAGTHRRVHFGDVDAYRVKKDRERRKGLDSLTRKISEAGFYDHGSEDAIQDPSNQ